MHSEGKNIIGKAELLFDYNGKTDGLELQQEVNAWWEDELLPAIGSAMDGFNEDMLLRIQNIALDVNVSSGSDWKRAASEGVLSRLRDEISGQRAMQLQSDTIDIGKLPGGMKKQATTQRFIREWLFYLQMGFMPWWAATEDLQEWTVRLNDFVGNTATAGDIETLKPYIDIPPVSERLVAQLAGPVFWRFLHLLSGWDMISVSEISSSEQVYAAQFDDAFTEKQFFTTARKKMIAVAAGNTTPRAALLVLEETAALYMTRATGKDTLNSGVEDDITNKAENKGRVPAKEMPEADIAAGEKKHFRKEEHDTAAGNETGKQQMEQAEGDRQEAGAEGLEKHLQAGKDEKKGSGTERDDKESNVKKRGSKKASGNDANAYDSASADTDGSVTDHKEHASGDVLSEKKENTGDLLPGEKHNKKRGAESHPSQKKTSDNLAGKEGQKVSDRSQQPGDGLGADVNANADAGHGYNKESNAPHNTATGSIAGNKQDAACQDAGRGHTDDTAGADRRNAAQTGSRKKAMQAAAKEGIYINNAGVIIVAGYLATFFRNMQLVAENRITDKPKAIALLHYLVTGNDEFAEFEVVLPKILCGIDPDEFVDASYILTDEDKAQAGLLLQAVIDHWSALKNTSVDGLRSSFLMRDGKLTFDEDKWRLYVQEQPFDILIDLLPWNINMTRLPWMQYLVYVDWRNK